MSLDTANVSDPSSTICGEHTALIVSHPFSHPWIRPVSLPDPVSRVLICSTEIQCLVLQRFHHPACLRRGPELREKLSFSPVLK